MPLPPILLSDKLSLVTHHRLLTRVLVKLDLENWNYASWVYFFKQLCSGYEIFTTLLDDLQARTMATTIEQLVAMDEVLVPSTQRCPYFKAFLVTADVPEIYMQEFWATAYVHQHSIRFKMNNKKHIVNLESFRDMLHICPRIPGQSFDEIPFEEEIMDFIRDDFLFSMIKVVSRHQNTQQYGAMLPIELTNDEIRNTKAYKEYYAFATEEAAPKPKASARRKRSDSDTSITPPTATTTPKPTVAATLRLTAAVKGKQPAKATKAKSTDEGTGFKPRVPDVPTDESEEDLSWNSSDDEGANDQGKDGDDDEGDEGNESDEGEEDADEDKDGGDDEEEGKSDEEDDNEEIRDEESFNPIPKTPKSSEDEGDGGEDQVLNVNEEEHIEEEEEDELYRDQESSSVSSQFVTSMLNPISDVGIESIFATASSSVAPLPTSTPIMTPSTISTIKTISQAPIPPTLISSEVLQNLPTFALVFRFDDRLKSLEANFSKFRQTNLLLKPSLPFQSVNAQLEAKVLTRSSRSSRTFYAVAADLSEMELKKILIKKMKGNKSIQCSDKQRSLYKALVDAYETDKIILYSYEETVILKRRRDDDDDDKDDEPSAGLDRGSKRRREEEPVQTTSQIEEPSHPVFETSSKDQPIVQSSKHPEWFSQPQKPPTPDRDWNKTLPAVQGSTQTWISKLAKPADSRSSFNELLDTPLDFSNFIMNRLRVDALNPKLIAGPTYELMNGSCTSLIELEYHLEEVYKATTDQLNWVNPEGQHNDLEYLCGGSSSHKYTTSVMKTKAADYGYIKWIEDLVPSTMWIQEPIYYDKHALWGVSHWGRKRQQFYGFDVNRESARNVYSKKRIIAVTDLKIMECDETLNDVCTALDDRLKGIRMQYLPQTIWRKGDKDRAAAMIQANDKMLKTRRIMRSLEKFVGGKLLLQPNLDECQSHIHPTTLLLTDLLQKTLKRRWRYLILAESQIHNHMLIPDYQDIIFQDFRYSDGFECYQVIKIGRKIESIATIITSLGSPVSSEDVVMFALEGMPKKRNVVKVQVLTLLCGFLIFFSYGAHGRINGVEKKKDNTDKLLVKILGHLGLDTPTETSLKSKANNYPPPAHPVRHPPRVNSKPSPLAVVLLLMELPFPLLLNPELKCKALADLGASINLMPLSVWKTLGLPDLILTRMTLELANHAIYTPDGIARDVFVPVGNFTFPADFVVVDYESDPRVPFILGRPFLRTARALIDVYGEEMILRDGDERLTLNMKHDTASYSNHPHRESVNLINIFNVPSEDCLEVSVSNQKSGNHTFSLHKEIASPKVTHEIHDSEGCNFLSEELPDIDSFNDIHPYFDVNLLSGSTTYSSNSLLEEFTDELALITYLPDYDDNLKCDIESDLREIEFLLYQGEDSDLKDSIDQMDLDNLDAYFVDPTPEMFTDEHAPDYSFMPRFDVYDDDFLEIKSDADNFYDDPFDSKGEKIKESELLIDELDLPCDFLPYSEYDSFTSQDISSDDDLPSPDNEDKVFNPGILIHEKSVIIITRVAQEKKLVTSYASLVFEDFDPPFYEPIVFKDVSNSMRLLLFSSENEEKVFKPGIYTSEKTVDNGVGYLVIEDFSSIEE
uniref:Reverse transcriptase domain-containing protein n=1 Tax=Tanacetum cinerariifolium TaxID=118510 RepID=A0A6L2LRI9_TANCI|nr:reverse transcriptase domain-containing protein [Tanacetum cinerariifolium]